MDLISLLITIIGIMVLLGLYVMSRVYDQRPASDNKTIKIPLHTDSEGQELTSIRADIPATDSGRRPVINKDASQERPVKSQQQSTNSKNQHILFIASQTSAQLDGNAVMDALEELELKFGEQDIYHYQLEDNHHLFSIANGISPWTLTEADLSGKSTPGLSMIMQMPTPIDDRQAIELFVATGEKLAEAINGELQNNQQQIYLQTDKDAMLASVPVSANEKEGESD